MKLEWQTEVAVSALKTWVNDYFVIDSSEQQKDDVQHYPVVFSSWEGWPRCMYLVSHAVSRNVQPDFSGKRTNQPNRQRPFLLFVILSEIYLVSHLQFFINCSKFI